MKKILIRAFSITTTLYTVVYLYLTFMRWEFQNPFQWIIDIPTYSFGDRGGLLACILFYYVLLFASLITAEVEKREKERKNNKKDES